MNEKEKQIDPAFSRRAGTVLRSPIFYQTAEETNDKEAVIAFYEKQSARLESLRDALQQAKDYDDLKGDAKKLFDEAEQAQKDYDADMDTYGERMMTLGEIQISPEAQKLRGPTADESRLLMLAMLQAKEQGADENTLQKIADLAKNPEMIHRILGTGTVGVRRPETPTKEQTAKKTERASKPVPPKIKSAMGYQSKKLSHDADIALRVIKQVAGQYNLAPIVAVRRALATAGFSSRGQQDSLINELRRAMRVSASGFEGRHGISKEEQDAAIVEGTTRLGFISLR
jgi:hypothetical protein